MKRTGQFQLSGAWNFRDLGGASTLDGLRVKGGAVYRSSELSGLDADGQAELSRLGVRRVVDLRGDSEIARSGVDRIPVGVQLVRIPYENHLGERAPHERGLSNARTVQERDMYDIYAKFAALDGAKSAIREVITTIALGNGPVLVHCAAGKDRAGWTIACVLRAAGVRDEDVVADFMASNSAIDPLREHVRAVWPRQSDGSPVDPSAALLGVTEEYYRHGLQAVDRLYGSFQGYIVAAGIDDGLVRAMAANLLESPS